MLLDQQLHLLISNLWFPAEILDGAQLFFLGIIHWLSRTFDSCCRLWQVLVWFPRKTLDRKLLLLPSLGIFSRNILNLSILLHHEHNLMLYASNPFVNLLMLLRCLFGSWWLYHRWLFFFAYFREGNIRILGHLLMHIVFGVQAYFGPVRLV